MSELRRVRNRFFLGGMGAGLMAGFIKGLAMSAPSEIPFQVLQGLVLTSMSGFLGGFFGVFIRGAVLAVRGEREKTGDESITGVSMGMFAGGVLGLGLALFFGGPEYADRGAALGAFTASLLGCLPGESIHTPFIQTRREPS